MHLHSYFIGRKAAQTLYYIDQHAARIGRPINTHITINFACTGCDPRKAVKAFAKIRQNHFAKWTQRLPLRYRHEATGAYAFENYRDGIVYMTMEPGDPHNVHVHWAIHLPPGCLLKFEEKLLKWVARCCNGIVASNAVMITERPAAVLRSYLLDGCDPRWAQMYRATAEPQGLIVGGRRSGSTENLARKQRIARDRLDKTIRPLPFQKDKNGWKLGVKTPLPS